MEASELLRGSDSGLWESVWRLEPGEVIGIKLGCASDPSSDQGSFGCWCLLSGPPDPQQSCFSPAPFTAICGSFKILVTGTLRVSIITLNVCDTTMTPDPDPDP